MKTTGLLIALTAIICSVSVIDARVSRVHPDCPNLDSIDYPEKLYEYYVAFAGSEEGNWECRRQIVEMIDDVVEKFDIDVSNTIPTWAYDLLSLALYEEDSLDIMGWAVVQVGLIDADTFTTRIIEIHNIAEEKQWLDTYGATIHAFGRLNNDRTSPILRRLLVDLRWDYRVSTVTTAMTLSEDPSYIPDLEAFIEARSPCYSVSACAPVEGAQGAIRYLEQFKTFVTQEPVHSTIPLRERITFSKVIHYNHPNILMQGRVFLLNGKKGGVLQSRGIAIVKSRE